MSHNDWPDSDDPVGVELRRALDEARNRVADDVTLRRGWAGLAELVEKGPPARGRRWPYFAGGVATTAALGVACAALLWPRTMESRTGHPGAPSSPVAIGGPAAPGETGMRRLTLDGGVEAKLSASSVMRLEGGEPRVEAGDVRFSVPHRPVGHPFVVRAETYRVVVIGTRFGVAVDGDRSVAVDVDEGVVEVWGEGKTGRVARLHPGDVWHGPLLGAEVTNGPSGRALDQPSERPADRMAVRSSPVDRHRVARIPERTMAFASPGSDPFEAVPADGDPTAIARATLASGDATRALQMYRALAQRTGPAAENAAYEVGKILSEHLDEPASAVAAWRHYRTAYPAGLLRAEADVSIIETLARMGEPDDALGEATDFLRRRPDSERRAEIARVAGDLYRARGDDRRAVEVYQVAIAAGRPQDAAEAATFHRAACLIRLGDATGREAARAYLRSYPSGRFRREAAVLVAGDARSP